MRRMSADWPSLVKQFKQSGQTQKEFCAERRVSLSSLGYWLKKDRNNGNVTPAAEGARFIELEFTPTAKPAAADSFTASARQADVVIELPFGVVMRFHGVAR